MIDPAIQPEQARLWASLIGRQASSANGPAGQGTYRPGHVSPLVGPPTMLDRLLQRIRARQEARKDMRAAEFMAGV